MDSFKEWLASREENIMDEGWKSKMAGALAGLGAAGFAGYEYGKSGNSGEPKDTKPAMVSPTKGTDFLSNMGSGLSALGKKINQSVGDASEKAELLTFLLKSLKDDGLSGDDYRIDITDVMLKNNVVQLKGEIIADSSLDAQDMTQLIKDNLQRDLFFFLAKKNQKALTDLGAKFEVVDETVSVYEKVGNVGKFTAKLIVSSLK